MGVWYLGPVPIRAYALLIILGIIVAVIFLGEEMSAARLLGAALVIGALIGFSVSESRAPATPAHQ